MKTVIKTIYGAAGHVLPCMRRYSTSVSLRHAMINDAPLSNVQKCQVNVKVKSCEDGGGDRNPVSWKL